MNAVLFQFGLLQFQIYPLNVSDVTHMTQSDWARKEIAGSAIFREWVGEGDEEISLRGKIFPFWFGLNKKDTGMDHLDLLDEYRRYGSAQLLMRGDGIKVGSGVTLGWYVIERLSRGHSLLRETGVGQQVEFDATFVRVPTPDGGNYYANTIGVGRV